MSSRRASELIADPAVARGMAEQLELRQRRLAAGERPLGWKVGFGSPTAMSGLGIVAPLVGFLTDASRIELDSPPDVGAWANPVLEPEVALTLGTELGAGADRAEVAAALAGLAPAFELVDVSPPPRRVDAVLAANIFHRFVGFGPSAEPAALATIEGAVDSPRGVERVVDPAAATGDPLEVVGHVADVLGELGLTLGAGEVVICGSIVAPIQIAPGDRISYALEPAGSISIELPEPR